MAYGEHWEWRGFGSLSGKLEKKYGEQPLLFPYQKVIDEYLWTPGLEVNIKMRTGAEGGFKFKRLKRTNDPFEKWEEKEEEIFYFPLGKKAWDLLRKALKDTDAKLPSFEKRIEDKSSLFNITNRSGFKIVIIDKLRESRVIQAPYADVKIEKVKINSPVSCISIGLENWNSQDLENHQQLEDLKYALDFFGLEKEKELVSMNYLDAVKKWSNQ
jgi:hypothetical protein